MKYAIAAMLALFAVSAQAAPALNAGAVKTEAAATLAQPVHDYDEGRRYHGGGYGYRPFFGFGFGSGYGYGGDYPRYRYRRDYGGYNRGYYGHRYYGHHYGY